MYSTTTDNQGESFNMAELAFEDLACPGALSQGLLLELDLHFKSNQWRNVYQCITMLRQICKFHPQLISDCMSRYASCLLDVMVGNKTQLTKNILKLTNEVFKKGKQVNVEKAVYSFMPVIIRKAAAELTHIMRELAQQALTSLIANCGYDISFIIASEFCCDKNVSVAQFSLKLLTAIIQIIGQSIILLNQTTLKIIMQAMHALIIGKRQNLKSQGLDICVLIYKQIGKDNFLQLMNYSLKNEQAYQMGTAMEMHKVTKQRPEPFSSALKKRRTEFSVNEKGLNPEAYNSNFNERQNFPQMGNVDRNWK